MKKLLTLTTIALTAALPTLSSAEGVAASLSASFGTNAGSAGALSGTVVAPASVSVAGAAGGFAVASSVATATSSGAASGATDNADFPPQASVTYNAGAYETNVMFAPAPDALAAVASAAAAQAIANLCTAGFTALQGTTTASQSGSTATLNNPAVVTPVFGFPVNGSVQDTSVNVTNGAVTITNGAITVSCS